jgi:ubiquinone/menaquinone biosynthesis C-methylase UbiE
MSTQSDDLARNTQAQRQQWDSVAAGWKKWWRAIENGAQHVSKRMLELAEIQPGQRVLDIATGIGEPALLAASRVGASGSVVATDLSSEMLDIARDRANALGLTNVKFIASDMAGLDFPDGSFDTILCRWGVTSLPDPSNTLVTIRRMLTSGGSFATAVWEAGSKGRPMAGIAMDAAGEMFDLSPVQPGVPSVPGSARDALEQEMIHAGFTDVRVEEMTLTLELPSAEDCTQYLMDVSPEFAALLSDKSSAQREEYRRRLAKKLQPYVTADGIVRVPNVTVCAAGRK